MNCLVTGAGGAIGGHLVKALLDAGHRVRAVDIKPYGEWWQVHDHYDCANHANVDCSQQDMADFACSHVDYVYDLAEDMGGIGYITKYHVACAESVQIGIAMLRAAVKNNVERFFFSSSACVYPTILQNDFVDTPLRESHAWPAMPEEGYGFSKLYMEELCRFYHEEYGLETRVARYHNVFGEHSTWNDGKEKAPAAICRKVAEAVVHNTGRIDIWGSGHQMRSYLHVSDCVAGTITLMNSDYRQPMNLGSTRAISVNDLVSLVESFDRIELARNYVPGAQGVGGRNADITLAKGVLGWEPHVSLEDGLHGLYDWIKPQV